MNEKQKAKSKKQKAKSKKQKAYLAKNLETLRPEQWREIPNIVVDYFCSDEENANYCANLILRGEKTATCSMKY